MVFSTPLFLFYFLTITLILYYITPLRLRNVVLLLASLFFYYWGEQIYVLIMLLSTAVDYTHGLLVSHFKKKGKNQFARLTVASSIFFNLSILLFFKYWDFIAISLHNIGIPIMPILGISLPIGISFFTFQTMSYTIDVYRGHANVQKNIIHFSTFVTLFPQLIAGPIIKYKELDTQLVYRTHTIERFASGITIFIIGLSKKLLIANNLGLLWDTYKMMSINERTVGGAWLGLLAFTFQIYFDFSGYSDMAVGLGRMFGFEFIKNFHYPYISKSITEFWRRWHISLSTWFRDYLYIPLGGNRCSKIKWMRNLFIVWIATGIWHGANWNFVLWGLYFFVLLFIEKLFFGKILQKLPTILQHLYTLFFILISWAIFAIEDFAQLQVYMSCMFHFVEIPFWNTTASYYLKNYFWILIIAAFSSTPFASFIFNKLPCKLAMMSKIVLLTIGIILCTAYVVADSYNPFLYFRF